MMGVEITYVPAGKYTTAGVRVLEVQSLPHRPPDRMALLIAAVSSVTPSPLRISYQQLWLRFIRGQVISYPLRQSPLRCGKPCSRWEQTVQLLDGQCFHTNNWTLAFPQRAQPWSQTWPGRDMPQQA